MSLLVTIPHSGEKIPPQTPWLTDLPETILMCDVDRFVDILYEPALKALSIPLVKTEWHRYAADLNRIPTDVNAFSVVGHSDKNRKFNRGFHWVNTTYKHQLMKSPMPVEDHEALVRLVYDPFHAAIRETYKNLRSEQAKRLGLSAGIVEDSKAMNAKGATSKMSSSLIPPAIFHIDAHSMPSVGTSEHLDPSERRADIVVSDCKGKSCDSLFRDLVIVAYVTAGFKVGFNWPYFGGRLTQHYGKPALTNGNENTSNHQGDLLLNQHVIQVEMNRNLYMNEETKKLEMEKAALVQKKVQKALGYIQKRLPALEEAIMKKQRQAHL